MLLLGNNYKQTVFRKKKLCSGKVTPGILSAIGKTRKKGVNRMVTGLETVGGGGVHHLEQINLWRRMISIFKY